MDRKIKLKRFSHRDYFRRYKLNAEQYGEILIAQAFDGLKLGDAQHCYDVRAKDAAFRAGLRSGGACAREMATAASGEIRIEVKSKLLWTEVGDASVVHCADCKLNGSKSKKGVLRLGMTHLAVLLVNPGSRAGESDQQEGRVEKAWLLSVDKARALRQKDCKSQYIRVSQLLKEEPSNEFCDVTTILNRVADRPIDK